MARLVRGCPTARSKQEGAEEPQRDPQQENQQDATGDKDIEDYNSYVDYEGSEPKVEMSAPEQREVDTDAEDANMEISQDGTLHQRMMPQEQYMEILWVHRAQGPEIMATKLQNMYIQFGYSPKEAKLLIREQGLNNPDRLRVLINNNVKDIYNVMRNPGRKNADGTPNREQHVSVI